MLAMLGWHHARVADASVRPATPDDASAVARVQAAAWREVYAGVLPEPVLAAMDSPESAQAWAAAVRGAPTPRHRVLLALEGTEVAGFVALGPAGDPDLDPEADAELYALCVDPSRTGAGHGSRLVNAAADVMGGHGVARLHVWLSASEQRLRTFLESAGWAPDGATRRLDLHGDGAVVVDQTRLSTRIG